MSAEVVVGQGGSSVTAAQLAPPSNGINEGNRELAASPAPSRYESQKRRDWNTFGQYLKNHRPPLALPRCSGAHVVEFLHYLDQFGKTKVHVPACPFFGHPHPPAPCACPLRQAWGSLDALIGRLRAAYEENGGKPESNPFGARAVRLYLREVRESQAKARGIAYEKKKRKRPPIQQQQQQQQQPNVLQHQHQHQHQHQLQHQQQHQHQHQNQLQHQHQLQLQHQHQQAATHFVPNDPNSNVPMMIAVPNPN